MSTLKRRWSDQFEDADLGAEAATFNHTYATGYYDGCKAYQRRMAWSMVVCLVVGALGGGWLGYGVALALGG